MNFKGRSIRTFIGAKNFEESRRFYNQLQFKESIISKVMSVFYVNDSLCFYLQDYYVKQWVNNSMIFLEVDDVDVCHEEMMALNLQDQYKYVRITDVKFYDWGREFFMHDPSGVLWHFGQFNNTI